MDEESKQYTAFTLGSMGLYECESMPFGLCNALPTFQRLMQNCLGELNLTYCLIYLDDVIIFSQTEEEHLERMRVVFGHLREHGLKLKPSKCEVFKTEQRYYSNKQEFLALKWAVTEQCHEYMSPYGKNRNEFVVCTDNNPLTYIFSTANLDATGQRWVAHLASYNFALEYQKGKDNTVADFLSCMDDRLPEGEVQDYLNEIPYPGVKAVLDNAITPLTDRAEIGLRPDPNCQTVPQEETIGAKSARLATTNVTDWKLEQKEDPILYQVVKHQKASREVFKEALLKVADRKAVAPYIKSKEQLIIKNGLLYRQSKQGPTEETVFQFVVPQIHRSVAMDGCHREVVHQGQQRSLSLMKERFWWPGMARDLRNCIKKCGHCKKFEAAPPITPMKPLTCSGPGELLHVDFTFIEETVPLHQEPVIRNVMVMQDHFSKYVVAYVVKDQTA